MQPTRRLIDPGLEADFERDGYVVADFLDAEDVVQLLHFFRSLANPIHAAPFGASILSQDLDYRREVDRTIKAVFGSKLDLLFDGYRHCFSNFVFKEPQAADANAALGIVPLHQDLAVVDESRYQSLGIWCPLVDVDPVNGCLYVVPGSHRLNTGPRGPGTFFPYQELIPLFEQRHLRAVPMKAGQAFVFCQKVFHTSQPNRGSSPRIVAGGLFAPREAQLYCYYQEPQQPQRMTVFEVDDLFYTRYIYGTRPAGVPVVGEIDYWYDPIAPERLAG
jgi:hypothetical protein